MKLTTRKERILFDVGADLTARHRIRAAFCGYKTRMSKLIMDTSPETKHEDTLSNNHRGNTALYDVEVGTRCSR